MSYLYPINLDISGKKCLVIGGGNVAQRKVASLLECNAQVLLVSPEVTPQLKEIIDSGKISFLEREFYPDDLNEAFLVISATDDQAVNSLIAEQCFQKNILVNVVDVPQKCNFYVPSVVRRGDLAISISTGGNSPLAAKKIREDLEKHFGKEYARYLSILGELRKKVLEEELDPRKRKIIFERLVDSDLLELVREGNEEAIKERITQCISW